MAQPAFASAAVVSKLYTSAAGAAELQQLYTKTLSNLPFPHEERLVQTTSFGSVHVVICGPPTGAPLLLWHGTAAPAPFMLRAFRPLVERFRVFTPDLPCQAGSRSEDAELYPHAHGYGKWAEEVVQALGLLPHEIPHEIPYEIPHGPDQEPGEPRQLSKAAAALPPLHVGVSLGAALLLDLAVVRPETIRGAVLEVPGCVHPGCESWHHTLRILSQLVFPSTLYKVLPCKWTAWLALRGMCDEPQSEDPLFENIKLAFRHVRYYPRAPLKFTDEQLARLTAPTLVIAAEHVIFGAGRETAARAQQAIPDEAVVFPGARHCMSARRNEEVNERILDFFATRGMAYAGATGSVA